MRLVDKIESGTSINFDVQARLEEKERRSGLVKVGFVLNVGTKPNIVKFEAEGLATLEGKDEEVKKMLDPDRETKIPMVFHRVYQHVFMSMYLLATLINAPSPPVNLSQQSARARAQQLPSVELQSSAASTSSDTMRLQEPATPKETAEESTDASIGLGDPEEAIQASLNPSKVEGYTEET
jgi:hypothetical protein